MQQPQRRRRRLCLAAQGNATCAQARRPAHVASLTAPSCAQGIPGGRRAFHGERELYRSDHRDVIHSDTILGRCVVHSLDKYRVRWRAEGWRGVERGWRARWARCCRWLAARERKRRLPSAALAAAGRELEPAVHCLLPSPHNVTNVDRT